LGAGGKHFALIQSQNLQPIKQQILIIILFIVSENVYVAASRMICGVDSRCIEMIKSANDKRAHWKLFCYQGRTGHQVHQAMSGGALPKWITEKPFKMPNLKSNSKFFYNL
jgi:hypothetical protein